MVKSRELALRIFMLKNDITYQAIANIFGVTDSGARFILLRDRISKERHDILSQLGFPCELLPEPFEASVLRSRAKVPRFPGISQEIHP